MNGVSKNNVVSERGTNGGTDTESDDSSGSGTTVDIGIKVDVGSDGGDADEGVAFAFDEGELLEDAAGDGDDGTDADGEGDAADTDGTADAAIAVRERDAVGERRLEDDERAALEAAEIDPDAVPAKEYSYRMLLDAGVDESTADALRRRFSLPWSFEGDDGDLERRSSEIRGLGEAEREWIAVSDDEEWQAFEYARSRAAETEPEEETERPWPRPTPVTACTGVGPDDAEALAEAGIISAERLATINAFEVAKVLDLNVLHVRTWRHNARELLD